MKKYLESKSKFGKIKIEGKSNTNINKSPGNKEIILEPKLTKGKKGEGGGETNLDLIRTSDDSTECGKSSDRTDA